MRHITGAQAVRDFILAETGPTLGVVYRDESGQPPAEALATVEDASQGTTVVLLRVVLDERGRKELEDAGLFGALGANLASSAGNIWLLSRGRVAASVDIDLSVVSQLEQLLQRVPPIPASALAKLSAWLERELRAIESDSLSFEMAFAEAARAIRASFPPERAEQILRALREGKKA